MITGLCSSGRSDPQVITFCLLTTPLIVKLHSSEKTNFGKSSKYSSGCDKQNFAVFRLLFCHFQSRLEDFEACLDKKEAVS